MYVRSRREGGAKAHEEMLPGMRTMDIPFRSNFRNFRSSGKFDFIDVVLKIRKNSVQSEIL